MMKKLEAFHFSILTVLALSAMPAVATAVTQKVKDTTTMWHSVIEPGVTPVEENKYKVVNATSNRLHTLSDIDSALSIGLMSESAVVPGTNMSAMILDKLKVSEQVTPETTALFGETIDLNTGAVSLQQTDISIPGNFNIPVEFRRIFKGASYAHYLTDPQIFFNHMIRSPF